MTEMEKVIKGLECCGYSHFMDKCQDCPYDGKDCFKRLKEDALALLKAQEPRVITIADFENNHDVDDLGYLNAWVDYKDGNLCGWATICVRDVGEFVDVRRYWTSRPTDEQKEATPWN